MSLFVEGAYDVLEFIMPPNGMNQNISPKILPSNFAYVLENILPIPQGRGMVRYGTSLINSSLPPDSNILEIFPFIKTDGGEQLIIYVQQYEEDLTILSSNIISQNSFSFDTGSPSNYIISSPIKITYSGPHGTVTFYSTILDGTVSGSDVTLTLSPDNIFPSDFSEITITHIYYSEGNIYFYDFNSETLSSSLINGLSVTTVPRSETFQNVLIICNGFDRLMSWDGNSLKIIIDFVKELGTSFNWIDDIHFSFIIPDNFDITKYQNNALIQVNINGVVTSTQVTNISLTDEIATITTSTDIPEFTGEDAIILSYGDYPPTFNYLFAAHDRLWALGPGEVGLKYRTFPETMKVYYANQTNSYTAWFDEQTKVVLSEDLSDKHGISDNLEAICLVNNLMVFIGRYNSQAWQGYDPTPNANPSTEFQWAYNIPVGIAHGNLLVELPNDVYIVTENGIVSLSTFNIARQLAASPYDAVDPLIRQYVKSITVSDITYSKCRSFKYKGGPFCGFKIGDNKLLVSLYSTNLYAWSFFSGDFLTANSFCSSLNNSLYLGIGNKIYKYADGKDGGNIIYGDQNGESTIPYFWTLPVVHQSGKRYANKRYEIQLDYPSSFFINDENEINIEVFGDIRQTFDIQNIYQLFPRGDVFNTVPLVETAVNPNKPLSTTLGMRLDIPYEFIKGRLKFISSSFWLNIYGYCINGPLYLDRVRLFGIMERNS